MAVSSTDPLDKTYVLRNAIDLEDLDVEQPLTWARPQCALLVAGIVTRGAHDGYGTAGHRWVGNTPLMFALVARSAVTPELRGGTFRSPDKRKLMATLTKLVETGRLRIVIDRTFPLSETAAALSYLASGQAVGRVVVTVGA